MDGSDSPSDLAKKTLSRLARERLVPLPENYCQTYRRVKGEEEPWQSYCRYTRLLQEALHPILGSMQTPALEAQTARLAGELEQEVNRAATEADLCRLRDAATMLGAKMQRHLEGEAEKQAVLADILRLIAGNLGSLADEDRWFQGQMQAIEELLEGSLTAANLHRTRNLLEGVVERQQGLRTALADAQQVLKSVMAELVRQAGELAENTSGYEERIGELSRHVEAADNLEAIRATVGELGEFVRDMGASVHRSHHEMVATQSRLVVAERQILDLRHSLAETSEKARRDTLTGTLNRSGLEDIWQREVQRAQATDTALSVALLDVDNFKTLNDRLGHKAGDDALVHLSKVIRDALHGTDTMARYGGEEFVILLPDTDDKGALAVMKRLQRELTKHFFLHDQEKVLITFSAGVTPVRLGQDSLISALERADAALYEAKRSGKKPGSRRLIRRSSPSVFPQSSPDSCRKCRREA